MSASYIKRSYLEYSTLSNKVTIILWRYIFHCEFSWHAKYWLRRPPSNIQGGGVAGVFVASKLFISTGLGGALKISHFITCLYWTVLEVIYLLISPPEIIYLKKKYLQPPPPPGNWMVASGDCGENAWPWSKRRPSWRVLCLYLINDHYRLSFYMCCQEEIVHRDTFQSGLGAHVPPPPTAAIYFLAASPPSKSTLFKDGYVKSQRWLTVHSA